MPANFDASSFQRGLASATAKKLAAARQGMDEFGEVVIGHAQQLTPVDKGTLQGSGTTEPAESAEGGLTKLIGFNTEYAAAVHENLEANHKVGQAKFLEAAMTEDAPKMAPYVAAKMAAVEG
jgi:hypothetical protein